MIKKLLFTTITFFVISTMVAQVGINYDGSEPASHSILDVKSDSTGMIIPRLNTTQRGVLASKLDNSHKGMLVYDKTGNMMFFWNGSEFENFESGGVTILRDEDGDTYIDTDSGVDPDYIAVSTGGTIFWIFDHGRLATNNTGSSVFIGEGAGVHDDLTDNKNVFIGQNAGTANSTGYENAAIGYESFIANTSGANNTAFGSSSLKSSTTASFNTAIGSRALENTTTSAYNTALGTYSLRHNTIGAKNVALGYASGFYTGGSKNTIIGYRAGRGTSANNISGNVFIGYEAGYFETGDNKLYIENSNSSSPLIYGDFSNNVLGFMGDVGIGTKNPLKDLHIMGTTSLASLLISPNTSVNGNSEILFTEDDDFTYGMFIKYNGNDNRLYFYGKADADTSGSHLTIERDGNVGIGTDNPTEAFEVVTTSDRRTVYFTGEGQGIDDATVYSDNTSTGSGIAGFFQTAGTDATFVLKQNGTGHFLKAFGPDGGDEEWNVRNDGTMQFYNSGHHRTIAIEPSESGTNDAGQITLYDATGTIRTIEIDGDYNGNGRITTNELQITGGSDLSEFFELSDYSEIKKGMVVSIDENNPGQLKITTEAYDKKVAGIVSGANSIKPGLIMSQKGTIADGEHLIALSGRVYCMVDATKNPVEIGDMLTTSSTPGHAMKVDDYQQAQGSIIGKAMTSLKKGKGLVLVLVTLQ